MSGTIRFLLNDQLQELAACDPTRTVLEYLREDQSLTGTKEGCAEGDCGACTVVTGELQAGKIQYRAVNACIQLLASLDGKQLITVEHLQQPGGELHPVQRAMVDEHGSQCGFCTPGFVMSLFGLYHHQQGHAADRDTINIGLSGNLCRCTGYAPIIRAAQRSLSGSPDDQFSRAESRTVALLQSIQDSEPLAFTHAGRRFFAPRDLEQLCALLAQYPDACMIAGATDVGLWITKQLKVLDTVIYLGRVAELRTLQRSPEMLEIGAAVTYTEAIDAMCELYPGFSEVMLRLGGLQVRNAGTVGGNIANGSPIGDSPPLLIAAGARLVLHSSGGRREMALENFFIDYGKQDLASGECVSAILLPVPDPAQQLRSYKLSKRFDQDISAVCAAFALTLDQGRVSRIRIAYGGMAATPKRASHCEAVLSGARWDQAAVDAAKQALATDFQAISDMRASEQYRLSAAQNMLQRFFLETSADGPPLRLSGQHWSGHAQA